MTRLVRAPSVSILMPAWGEGALLARAISAAEGLDYPELDIIVAAGGPNDTYRIACEAAGPRTRVIEQRAGRGKQGALNDALALGGGEVIVLVDGDCVIDDQTFRLTLAPLAEGSSDASSGRVRPLDEQLDQALPTYQFAKEWWTNRRAHPGPSRGFQGANAAIQRRVLEKIGGFDESARTGTDYNLAQHLHQARVTIHHEPWNSIQTRYASDASSFVKRERRWLKNHLTQGRMFHVKSDVSHYWRTVAVGVVMMTSPLIAILFPTAMLVAAPLWAHAVGVRIRWYVAASRDGVLHWRPPFLALPVVGALLDYWAWASSPFELLTRAGRERW